MPSPITFWSTTPNSKCTEYCPFHASPFITVVSCSPCPITSMNPVSIGSPMPTSITYSSYNSFHSLSTDCITYWDVTTEHDHCV